MWAALDDDETAHAIAVTAGDTYATAIHELTEAFEGVDADEAEILRIIRGMSAADRERLRTESPPILDRVRAGDLGAAFDRDLKGVLETGRTPTGDALDAAYGGRGDGTDEDMASDALASMSATLIGLPSLAEMQSEQGRIDAATIMLERQRERLEMSGGLTDALTKTDDTAAFAHIEFEARYNQAMAAEGISIDELAVLVALDEQFNRRFEDTGAEGARQALSGAVNGAFLIAGAALAERAATLVGLTGRSLTAQIARSAAGAVEASVPGRAFARGALTGLIDGSLGGAAGELAMTLTDAETWKRSVWSVLARAGQALLRGGLLGGGAGAVAGGLGETAQGLLRARAIRDCAVQMEDGLGSGSQIDFTVGDDGALRGLTLRFGPHTPDGDLAAHVERIVTIRRAASLLGRARAALRDSGSFPLDTRAGEAAQEVPKLERMIQDRLRQLRGGKLSPQSSELVEAELAVIKANLDEFAVVLARGDLAPGTGRIGRPDAPPGFPDPPEGHYYRQRDNGWDLQRYPDSDAEPYTLQDDGAGGWRIVGRDGVAPPATCFPDGTSRETAFEQLVGPDSRSSFKPSWEMLRDNGLATRDEVIAAMIDPSERTEDAVRHALKEHFRGRVLARVRTTAAGVARSEAESLAELQRLTAGLNAADCGNLAEAWYGVTRGNLVAHPEMSPENNPGLAEVRRPDFVEGATLVEGKSTAQGLRERDVAQINDMLGVCAIPGGGRVTLPGGTLREVSFMRLVFTDIRGARGSAESLTDWLKQNPSMRLSTRPGGSAPAISQGTAGRSRSRARGIASARPAFATAGRGASCATSNMTSRCSSSTTWTSRPTSRSSRPGLATCCSRPPGPAGTTSVTRWCFATVSRQRATSRASTIQAAAPRSCWCRSAR